MKKDDTHGLAGMDSVSGLEGLREAAGLAPDPSLALAQAAPSEPKPDTAKDEALKGGIHMLQTSDPNYKPEELAGLKGLAGEESKDSQPTKKGDNK
jgi:hypothetical protein